MAIIGEPTKVWELPAPIDIPSETKETDWEKEIHSVPEKETEKVPA